jgi:hypothetical protein
VTTRPPAHQEGPSPITLGPAAAPLRRSLGPLAWCALEHLVATSTTGPGGLTVDAPVRALADELGVAKNTAHRALAALTRAGVVEPERRRGAGGAFEPSHYRLHLSPDVLDVTPAPKTRRAPRPSTSADDTIVEPAQLSLLDTA